MNTAKAVMKIRPEKNSGLYGIWTHDLCDAHAWLSAAFPYVQVVGKAANPGTNI